MDESALTGESLPVPKRPGNETYGGTVNQGGALEVRVTAPSADSAVARLVRLVETAQASRSDVERAVETFARHYTPVVVLAALLLATVPYAVGETGPRPAYTACVLLLVACPCALVLSTPVVAVCGLTVAARRGMLVKGSAHLERLGRLRVACVDKTGTLTEGRFSLTEAMLATPRTRGTAPRPALARARCSGGRVRSSHARRTPSPPPSWRDRAPPFASPRSSASSRRLRRYPGRARRGASTENWSKSAAARSRIVEDGASRIRGSRTRWTRGNAGARRRCGSAWRVRRRGRFDAKTSSDGTRLAALARDFATRASRW